MDNQLDLSRVISVITENPDLIARISALATEGDKKEELPTVSEGEGGDLNADSAVNEETAAVSSEPSVSGDGARKSRQRLLSAFKPYLSTERARAIDSMLAIADVLDTVRGR